MLFASVFRARVNPGPTPGSRCPGVHAVVCRDMTSARTRAVTSGSTGATAGSRDDAGSTTSIGGFDEHYRDHCSTRGNVRPLGDAGLGDAVIDWPSSSSEPCSLQTRSKPMNDNRHQDGIYPFPAGMQSREIETNGAKIHVRVGGHGPAVVMLHGFGTTGDMWGHLASALIEDHMVIAPDLRGLGLSSKPDGGYDKKNQAADVVGVLDALG